MPGWRDLWTEGRWEGSGARQEKSGVSVLGARAGAGCSVSGSLARPSFASVLVAFLRPDHWGKGGVASPRRCGRRVRGRPAPGLPAASLRPEGLPPVMTRVPRATSLVKSGNVSPCPLGMNCLLGPCGYVAVCEVPRNI